jgi:hypothetical protein
VSGETPNLEVQLARVHEQIAGLEKSGDLEVELARLAERMVGLTDAFEAEKTASKEAIAAAFKAAETATQAALLAQKESAEKSEANMKAQVEMHNGLIRKMDNLVTGFPDKDSLEQQLATRDARLNSLDKAVARAYGVAAGAGLFAGLFGYLISKVVG